MNYIPEYLLTREGNKNIMKNENNEERIKPKTDILSQFIYKPVSKFVLVYIIIS